MKCEKYFFMLFNIKVNYRKWIAQKSPPPWVVWRGAILFDEKEVSRSRHNWLLLMVRGREWFSVERRGKRVLWTLYSSQLSDFSLISKYDFCNKRKHFQESPLNLKNNGRVLEHRNEVGQDLMGRRMVRKELMMAKGHRCLRVNCQGRFTKSLSTGENAPWRHKTRKGALAGILDNLSNQHPRALISSTLSQVA